nr:MAG TPA: tail protein [Caudoviricetes sp.]
MLSVYTKEGFIPIETRQDYYYLMNYDGFHQLSFDVSVNDSISKHLINEAVIQNEDNRFLIKDINRRTKNITVTCELDMDEWKQTIFFDTAADVRFQTKLLGDILNVIKPNGWNISNAGIRTIKRTPELKDCTPYDVLVSLENTFNVVFDINVIKREVHVIDPEQFEYDGLYATPELNMKGVTWQGSSSDFCTRLFAYGKQDDNGNTTNISSVNGGKEYIEDHTYTDKVITLVWRDERYTDPQSLYDDARKKLDILCIPKMSYDISIYDLSQMNKEYDFLQFGLYKMVKTIVNEDVSILQRVVTYKKYYDKQDKNVITLSNEQQKFTSKVSNILGGSTNEIIHGSFLEQAQKESAAIINAFATKGHRYETESETYFLDKLPKEAAKYVMRMNLGGIAFSQNGWAGPYTTAWTIDGKFNADFISTGTLQAIKILGGSINIGDGKFTVGSNGKMKCIEGEFSGKITSASGNIGGWNITGEGLENGEAKIDKSGITNIYTWADLYIIRLVIMGIIEPNSDMIKHYDFNGSGTITSLDYIMLENRLKAL